MKKFIIIFSFLLFISNVKQAQEAVVSGGNYYENSMGSTSWTLGEIITETFRSDEVILTQGFQQPGLTVTSIDEHPELDFKITAFPNPVKDYLNIKLDTDTFERLSYELFDSKGNILLQKRFTSNLANISLQNLDPAVYFLRIIHDKKVLKTFKIVKQ